MASLIPLFPLTVVLLPATPLPLHIFEERYKVMFAELEPSGGVFGVVLARDNGVMNVGCVARVEKVLQRYEDGRLDLIAVGQQRFRILDLDKTKEFLQAEVEYFNDDEADEVPAELRRDAIRLSKRLRAIESPDLIIEPILDAPQLSFQLAQFITDLDKRQAILTMQSETERLEYLVAILPDYIAERERVLLAKRVAPLNGHAKQIEKV